VVSRELLQLIEEPPLADGRQPQLAPPGRHQGHLMALRIDPHCASQELGSLAASSSRRDAMRRPNSLSPDRWGRQLIFPTYMQIE
jgi:hypothetical protein